MRPDAPRSTPSSIAGCSPASPDRRGAPRARSLPSHREPAVSEAGATQARADVGTPSHQLPHEAGPVVLDHGDDGSEIHPEMPGRDPAGRMRGAVPAGRIERGPEAVGMLLVKSELAQ